MTRDFNKSGQNDPRPPFRNSPSNQSGDERSPRPARPRLNREMVDRAWENGAPRVHGDYHPRTNNSNGPAPRNNGRRNDEGSSSNSPGGSRSYGNRPEYPRNNAPRPERSFGGGNQGPRPYDANRNRNSDDARPDNRRSYGAQPERGGRPGFDARDQNNSHPGRFGGPTGRPQGRPPFRSQDDSRSGGPTGRPQGRPPFRDGGNPRPGGPGGFSRRGEDRHERNNPPKPYIDRNRSRFSRDAERPSRPPNPRALSRPWVQGQNEAQSDNEQFEGDYEGTSGQDNSRQSGSRGPDYRERRRDFNRQGFQPEERHVTQMPDGRVLKGSRPAQRKNAEFWTGVASDTETLIEQVHVPTAEDLEVTEENTKPRSETAGEAGEPTPRIRPKRIPGPVRRRKESAAAAKKARSSGPKPSQRGFKWPEA